MKKSRIIVQIIIGIAILSFILNKLDLTDVVSTLKKTKPQFFILACISYVLLNIVLASRLRYLLTSIGYRLKFIDVFFSHMGGMMIGDITPGRSGYFLTPSLLKKKVGSKVTDGMACIFAPQGIEFILKVGGAIAAIIYISTFPGISNDILISASIGAAFLLVVGILMLIIAFRDEKLTSSFLGRLPFFKNYTTNLSSFKEKNIGIKENFNAILLFTIIGWIFAALHWYFLGKALGLELTYFDFFLLHPLLTILMFVPISPAGFGLLEGGAIIVFSLFTISAEPAMAFILLMRASILLVDLLGLRTILASLRDLEI
ncbi:MAG: lysylphosphatidylglycerol synthase transmembrane domain-containing protein [Candidatus Methanoperedens sp.]|nr:lysylphosphatidylglycerol synthase transmembrane domain-containing protein [Candidatus Methanoperedens sp.]